jgi:hypothetical protein
MGPGSTKAQNASCWQLATPDDRHLGTRAARCCIGFDDRTLPCITQVHELPVAYA